MRKMKEKQALTHQVVERIIKRKETMLADQGSALTEAEIEFWITEEIKEMQKKHMK